MYQWQYENGHIVVKKNGEFYCSLDNESEILDEEKALGVAIHRARSVHQHY